MAGLTEDQKRRIDENRRKALERLQQRKAGVLKSAVSQQAPKLNTNASASNSCGSQVNGTSNTLSTPSSAPHNSEYKTIPALPRVELTLEQKQRIKENRERALQLQAERQTSFRDASERPGPVAVVTEQDRKRFKPEFKPPSIQKKDYIEYDFSTMKDSRGGFLDEQDNNGLKGPEEDPQSLQDWKEKQKQELAVKDLAPPIDLANAPRCFECNSLELDANLRTNFNVRVCRRCMKEKPEKYALLTKTECREDYLLTEPELKDTGLLRRIEKPNPHGFSRMQLFLRLQVEEYAWKKWGSAEGLDEEWGRREQARLDRREKRYQAKMRDMRKKTRAEEYTRKLRNGQALDARHTHEWSAPLIVKGNDRMVRRRCIDCGIETEEIII